MQKILILDFGWQYTHLIARRIRQMWVFSEIQTNDFDISEAVDVKWIILSWGPNSVYEKDSPQPHPSLRKTEIPILGLCYWHQLIANKFWWTVEPWNTKEYWIANLQIEKHILFEGLSKNEKIWMSHWDEITKLPEWFLAIAKTSDCETAAMANDKLKKYWFQFHPEVTHTPNGSKMLENFVSKICKVEKQRNTHNYTEQIINEIKEKVWDKNVFMLVSWWVDSTVAFTLLNKALGEKRCYWLFIDNGLMRYEEWKFVKNAILKLWYNNFNTYDASKYFIEKLKDISDPEQKRKIIWEVFIEIQQKVLKDLDLDPENRLLGQWTIYPDIIESQGTKHASLIKTHHNRIPMIQKMLEEWKVIEPLMNLYKDEVREIWLEIWLPPELVQRHPFPGPGLGIRVLCVWKNNLNKVYEIKHKLVVDWKIYILPIKSVWAQWDARTYKHPALLEWKFLRKELEKISTTLTNNLSEINRGLLLLWAKKNITAMTLQEEKYLTKDRLDLLRKIDYEVKEILKFHDIRSEIRQMPVVLVPFWITWETIILRPVNSSEAMTATFATFDKDILNEITKKILSYNWIDAVMFDITNKPPGTIERE